MRLRPSLLVLPLVAVALLATGCFESKTIGTVKTPVTVAVGATGQTVVNPRRENSTPATSSSTSATSTAGTATTGTTAGGGTTDFTAARTTFKSTCGSCHTLKDAGTAGTVGPNLDQLKPDGARVARQIAKGGQIMPAGLLKGQQAKDVAAYVAAVAGK
jgi:mono/diheme cytochrome c family protein